MQKPMLLDSLLSFEEVVMQPTLARRGKDRSAGGSVTWRYGQGGGMIAHALERKCITFSVFDAAIHIFLEYGIYRTAAKSSTLQSVVRFFLSIGCVFFSVDFLCIMVSRIIPRLTNTLAVVQAL